MAMFPLGTVLVPGAVLPLHVFEPRYRTMVERCLDDDTGFGVALIERGSEVGGGDARFDVACEASIVQAEQSPDGRWAIVTIGTRRLRVIEWLPDDPHPVAEVEEWPDDEPPDDLPERVERTRRRLLAVYELARSIGVDDVPTAVELVAEPFAAAWQLAAIAPIGPLDALGLLRAPGPADRLDLLDAHLVDLEVVLRSRAAGA
jgi:Lon protease-like protein